MCWSCEVDVYWLVDASETCSKVTLRERLQESGLDTWSSETSVLSAASGAQPQVLGTWTSETSALSAASSHVSSAQSHASSAQSHASSALASSLGSSHTGSGQHGPGKARKPEPGVPTKVEERVKLVSMLHPDQRQYKEARLQVGHTWCEVCVRNTQNKRSQKACRFCAG